MKGFLYKDLYYSKVSFIAILIIQIVCSAFIITAAIAESVLQEPILYVLASVGGYFITFLLSPSLMTDYFQKDESKNWNHFAVTVPDGVTGIVQSKYIVMILVQIFVSFCCVITDAIGMVLYPEGGSFTIIIMLLLIYNMFKISVQIPLAFYAGVKKGVQLSDLLLLVVAFIGFIYALFGDITMFLEGDFWNGFMKMLTEGAAIWILAVLPWIALFCLWVSFQISVKNYRKGVERRDE